MKLRCMFPVLIPVLMFFLFSGCDTSTSPEDNPLVGVWELRSSTVTGITDESEQYVYPYDELAGYNLDNDDDIESYIYRIFLEITDTSIRQYHLKVLTDTGIDITTLPAEYPDIFSYDSAEDIDDYIYSDSHIVASFYDEDLDMTIRHNITYSLEGDQLITTIADGSEIKKDVFISALNHPDLSDAVEESLEIE